MTVWPDFVGVKDASSQGVRGIFIGEMSKCTPIAWPDDVRNDVVSKLNPSGQILNSDLEMAGLLMLFGIMEQVCGPLVEKCVTLFSDNFLTVGWVDRLASCQSITATHLIQALALRLKANKCCSLTLQHISGGKNAMMCILSRSFGSVPQCYFKTDSKLLTLLNKMSPLPNQQSWTVFHLSFKLGMHVIFVLCTRHTTLDAWRQLPSARNHVGKIGLSMSNLWVWSLIYRDSNSACAAKYSRDLSNKSGKDIMEEDPRYALGQYVQLSRPLGR